MSEVIFLSVKFALETAALCGLLFYAVEGDAAAAFRAVGKRAYCFLIFGAMQEGIYSLVGTGHFSIVYVLWNCMALHLFRRMELRREKEFAGVWISYSVILFQFCQNFVTCMIYAIPGLAKQVKAFGAWERMLSTLLIWLIGAAAAAASLAKLPDRRTMSAKEARWAHGFFWFLFAAECLLSQVLTEQNMGNVLAVSCFRIANFQVTGTTMCTARSAGIGSATRRTICTAVTTRRSTAAGSVPIVFATARSCSVGKRPMKEHQIKKGEREWKSEN